MNRSPFITRFTLIASLSLLSIGAAWSAPESAKSLRSSTSELAQAKSKAPAKAKSRKSKASKAKAHKMAKQAAPKTTASSNVKEFVPAAKSAMVVTNPYFANQLVATLPKANPYLANPGITVAAVSAAVVAPAAALTAGPAFAEPASIVAAAAPGIAQPIAPAAPVAVRPPAAAASSANVPAYQPWNRAAGASNPYLAYQQPFIPADPAKLFGQFGDGLKVAFNALPQFGNPAAATTANVGTNPLGGGSNPLGDLFASLKMRLPLTGDSTILPTIKKVYPTGEKPLVVINFKCPTELIGVTPPPIMLLREALDFGFDGLNKTNLLSFNLQQVCS